LRELLKRSKVERRVGNDGEDGRKAKGRGKGQDVTRMRIRD